MRARSFLTKCQRELLVELFEQGMGYVAVSNRLVVSCYAVRSLYRRWLIHGRLSLVKKPTKQQYSFEFKKEIVDRFIAGETVMELAKEFKLSSYDLVRAWRKGGDEALKPKPKGRPKGSAKPVPSTEEDKLRREVEKLRAEVAYLKNCRT